MTHSFIDQLLIILTTGLLAGLFCRRWSLPPLMGYMVIGMLIGPGALRWIDDENHQIEYLAELGVFFLLFSIGLELSLDKLREMSRYFATGGPAQMIAVCVPVTAVLLFSGWSWPHAILIGFALAFSSTVLVFKSLGEMGKTNTDMGRRAIAVLLFQDAALVPMLLCLPLLAGDGQDVGLHRWAWLGVASGTFLAGTIGMRFAVSRLAIPRITRYRSPDLVVLLTLTILGGVSLAAYKLGLPAAIGAFAAGLACGGNRWSEQIDSLILPFREAFSAIFFVSLGLLINPPAILREPLLIGGGILLLIGIKTVAGAISLWVSGMPWRRVWGPSLGLAHVGEFAFVLILTATSANVLSTDNQQRLFAVAGGTLLVSPLLIRRGFRSQSETDPDHPQAAAIDHEPADSTTKQALVIGMGPVGQAVASRLESLGYQICVVDLNPLNLQTFAQFGIATVAGDAETPQVLRAAGVEDASVAVVCVPVDEVAIRTTTAIRKINPHLRIVVRCRYARQVSVLTKAGADYVFSEEAHAAIQLVQRIEQSAAPSGVIAT